MDRKKDVIKWIKQLGRLSTSRFVGLLAIEYDSVKRLLEELESEGKIIKEEETNSTYWRLQGEK